MKKIIFKILIILAILILLFSINTKVFAWSEIIQDGQSFINQADANKAKIDQNKLQELSGFLYNVLVSAGVVIAVIVATALGIKFVTGGAEGQAKVKEMLIPFVAGCIIVFGGFTIWKLALTIGNQIENPPVGTVEDASYHAAQIIQASGGNIDTLRDAISEFKREKRSQNPQYTEEYYDELISILQKEVNKLEGKQAAKNKIGGQTVTKTQVVNLISHYSANNFAELKREYSGKSDEFYEGFMEYLAELRDSLQP